MQFPFSCGCTEQCKQQEGCDYKDVMCTDRTLHCEEQPNPSIASILLYAWNNNTLRDVPILRIQASLVFPLRDICAIPTVLVWVLLFLLVYSLSHFFSVVWTYVCS